MGVIQRTEGRPQSSESLVRKGRMAEMRSHLGMYKNLQI